MAENAIVKGLGALYYSDGVWHLAADVMISDVGGGIQIVVEATDASITPASGWRALLTTAIRANASEQFGTTLDAVIFPDCG